MIYTVLQNTTMPCARCSGHSVFDSTNDGREWARGFRCLNCGHWEWINHTPSKVIPRLTQRGKYPRR